MVGVAEGEDGLCHSLRIDGRKSGRWRDEERGVRIKDARQNLRNIRAPWKNGEKSKGGTRGGKGVVGKGGREGGKKGRGSNRLRVNDR